MPQDKVNVEYKKSNRLINKNILCNFSLCYTINKCYKIFFSPYEPNVLNELLF